MKTIAEYLQNDPVSYDFSDDCTQSAAYQEKKGYEKYFIYRSPKPDGKEIYPAAVAAIEKNYQLYGKVSDPDAESNLLQNIYSLLWPEIQEEKSGYMMYKDRKSGEDRIYSDTMTSCQTVLNNYVKSRMPEVLERYDAKYVSNLMCIELYETDAAFKKLLEESEDLEHFIKVYHTLGNYIPVPYGFNSARSGYFGSHDSWDLTLMKIKEYYDAVKENPSNSGELFACPPEIKIMELLHCSREMISCYQWLNSFAGWEDFIDKNFLQDFVGKDYQPIPFCKGHSWEDPQISDHFDEFFRNAWKMIEKRSRRMIEEIKKKVVHKLLLAPIVCNRDQNGIRWENEIIYTGQRYNSLDPDMSDIALEFYKIIYHMDILDKDGKLQDDQYAGDTMCSFHTVAKMVPGAGNSRKNRTPYSMWPDYLKDYCDHYHCLANFWILPKKVGRNVCGTLCKAKRGVYDYMDRFLQLYKDKSDQYKKEYPDYVETFCSLEEEFAKKHFLIGSYVCENLEIVNFSNCEDPEKIIAHMQDKIEKRAESIKSAYYEELFKLAQRIGYSG